MVTSIIAVILAALKAFPILDQWGKAFVSLYLADKVKTINTEHITKNDKVHAQMLNLDKAVTIEEQAIQFSILNDIQRM